MTSNAKAECDLLVYRCDSWDAVRQAWRDARERVKLADGEEAWYRGVHSGSYELLPSLFWHARNSSDDDLDQLEQNLFFEFQARARDLHERGLSDWDYLFFMRHHGVPTRILDWTDSLAVALYFALETASNQDALPCIWVLNPYALNSRSWELRDLVQPKYLGLLKGGFYDYGELLNASGDWLSDGPVAIYPQQISDRMRAQRGWFTIFGNERKALEEQFPACVVRIDFLPTAVSAAKEFLAMAGMKPYAIYPDLDHLGIEVLEGNRHLVK